MFSMVSYVPKAKRHELVKQSHDLPANAHPGTNATVEKLKQHYWWPNMADDVSGIIKQCTVCRTQKIDRQGPSESMNSFQVYAPGERVAIDLIERVTESLNGNQYIIVAIDMFTRFVEAKAVPDGGAPTFTEFFIEYAGRYGVPHELLTDHSKTMCNAFTEHQGMLLLISTERGRAKILDIKMGLQRVVIKTYIEHFDLLSHCVHVCQSYFSWGGSL